MSRELNNIDELFKSRLDSVETAPSAAVKAALMKKVSFLMFRNTLFYVLLISAGSAAIITSSVMAFDSAALEKTHEYQEQLAALSTKLGLDKRIDQHSLLELNMLGSSINSEETSEITRIKGDSEHGNVAHKNSDLAHLNTSELPDQNVINDNSFLVNSLPHAPSSLSEVSSNGINSATRLTYKKGMLLENGLSDQNGSYLAKTSNPESGNDRIDHDAIFATDFIRGEKINWLPEKETNTNSIEKPEFLAPKTFNYSQAIPSHDIHRISNSKNHRPLMGPFRLGISARLAQLSSLNQLNSSENETRPISQEFLTSEIFSLGTSALLEYDKLGLSFGLEFTELKSSHAITETEFEYFDTTQLISTEQPVTINGEIVLDENGEQVFETVTTEITVPDSTEISHKTAGTNQLNFVSIPFNLSCDLYSRNRVNFGLNSELIYSRLVQAQGRILNTENSEIMEISSNSLEVNKNMISFNLGILVDYQVSRSLKLRVAPGYSLNSIYVNSEIINSKNYQSGTYLRFSLFKSL